MTFDLFGADAPPLQDDMLSPGAVVLRGFAAPRTPVRVNKIARLAILLRYALI